MVPGLRSFRSPGRGKLELRFAGTMAGLHRQPDPSADRCRKSAVRAIREQVCIPGPGDRKMGGSAAFAQLRRGAEGCWEQGGAAGLLLCGGRRSECRVLAWPAPGTAEGEYFD